MSDLIERCARAIFDKECHLTPSVMRHSDFADLNTRLWYLELARAAIEAMREPANDFMEQVHLRSYDGRFAKSHETYPIYRNFLRAFIDAALSQDTHPLPSEDR